MPILEKTFILGFANGMLNKSTPVSIGLAVLLIGMAYLYATDIQKISSRAENNAAVLEQVRSNYVPRTELENRLKSIEESQTEILRLIRTR